jgi:hypothetical protein
MRAATQDSLTAPMPARTAFLLTVAVFAARVTFAQPGNAGSDLVVYLDSVETTPGAEVTVPLNLFFTKAQEAPLRRMQVRMCIGGSSVHTRRVEPGPVLQASDGTVTLTQGAGEDGGCRPDVMEITFARPPQRGTIANVVFAVDPKAPAGERVPVRNTYAATAVSGDGLPIDPSASEISIVQEVSVIACFFYMH